MRHPADDKIHQNRPYSTVCVLVFTRDKDKHREHKKEHRDKDRGDDREKREHREEKKEKDPKVRAHRRPAAGSNWVLPGTNTFLFVLCSHHQTCLDVFCPLPAPPRPPAALQIAKRGTPCLSFHFEAKHLLTNSNSPCEVQPHRSWCLARFSTKKGPNKIKTENPWESCSCSFSQKSYSRAIMDMLTCVLCRTWSGSD